MSKKDIGFFLLIAIVIFSCMGLGWLLNDSYEDISYKRKINGLWLRNYNETEAKGYAQKIDNGGDWVLVNIRGMSPDEAFEVCQHEVGHEIFAEYCEQSPENFERCMEVFKNE